MSVKYEGGKIKNMRMFMGLVRHCAADTRYGANQKNKHVDETKKHLNQSFHGTTCADRIERLQNRLKALESTNTNKRKDRVFAYSIEIAAPAELKLDQAKLWFRDVVIRMTQMYGYEDYSNLIYADLHCDEVHDYIGPGNEKRTSRIHAHLCFVPEKDGSLNAKWFSSKSNMQKANQIIDDMCRENGYGTFLTGTKTRSRKTVSELKVESLERLQKQYDDLTTRIHSKMDEEASLTLKVKKYKDEHAERLKKDSERLQELKDARQDLIDAMKQWYDVPVNITVQAKDEDIIEFLKTQIKYKDGSTGYDKFQKYKTIKVKNERAEALKAKEEDIIKANKLIKAEAKRLRKEKAEKEKRQQRDAEIAVMMDNWKAEGYELGY